MSRHYFTHQTGNPALVLEATPGPNYGLATPAQGTAINTKTCDWGRIEIILDESQTGNLIRLVVHGDLDTANLEAVAENVIQTFDLREQERPRAYLEGLCSTIRIRPN